MRNRFPVATLSGASLVVVVVAIAAIVAGRPGPTNVVGSSPSASTPPATAPASAVAVKPTASPVAVKPTASPVAVKPTTGPCDEASLTARITSWEGAAGSRIANVELKNPGSSACVLGDRSRPMLVSGNGRTLINGKEMTTSHGLVLEPGVVHTTLVAASNYCGPDPVAPVTVAFVFADGRKLVAAPVSATDVTVPPCNGAGSPATIDMHPWAQ